MNVYTLLLCMYVRMRLSAINEKKKENFHTEKNTRKFDLTNKITHKLMHLENDFFFFLFS